MPQWIDFKDDTMNDLYERILHESGQTIIILGDKTKFQNDLNKLNKWKTNKFNID